MGVSLSLKAYAGKNSKEFLKHKAAVEFCIENELSYPKETSEFFKGTLNGNDLEDLYADSILEYIQDGVQVEIPYDYDSNREEIKLKTKDIPDEVDEIIIKLD